MASSLITERFLFNKEIVEIQLSLIDSFAQSLAYYRVVHQDYRRIKSSKEYWLYTMNTGYFRAINDWCIVFGPDANEAHWKKVSTKHEKEVIDEVRQLILSASGFSQSDWTDYWRSLTEFRHQYVAHKVPEFSEIVPHLTKAYEIAEAYFEWLKENLRPSFNEPKRLGVLYAEYQIEVVEVLKNYLQKI